MNDYRDFVMEQLVSRGYEVRMLVSEERSYVTIHKDSQEDPMVHYEGTFEDWIASVDVLDEILLLEDANGTE